MNLTPEAKQKVMDYFDSRYGLRESTKGFFRLDCPLCAGRNTGAIQEEYVGFHCFKCGEKMSGIRVVMELENMESFRDAVNFLALGNLSRFKSLKETRKERSAPRPLALPEHYHPINQRDGSKLSSFAQNYMIKRGYDLDKLALKGVGYATEGEYAGYIIFPFYSFGVLKFFQGRKFAGGGPKMRNPEASTYGIGKSQLIYNADALLMYDEVNIIESITNCLTLDENSISILGKTLSPYQQDLILRSSTTTFNIILDPDAWGDALKMAAGLVNHKRIKVTPLPRAGVDVNDLGYDMAMKYITKAKVVSHRDILNMRFNNTTRATYN